MRYIHLSLSEAWNHSLSGERESQVTSQNETLISNDIKHSKTRTYYIEYMERCKFQARESVSHEYSRGIGRVKEANEIGQELGTVSHH